MERREGINAEAMDLVQTHYSRSYAEIKEDSPNSSRNKLRRRLRLMSEYLSSDDYVLDLGGGRQIFERSYRQAYGDPAFRFVSVDFAQLSRKQLLSGAKVPHVRSSGCSLPFRDSTFSVVTSSMALDFMPKEAISEMARVMKPDAKAIVTLHHKDLIENKLRDFEPKRKPNKNRQAARTFFEYLKDNSVLFENPEQIRSSFEETGFVVADLRLANDRHDKWWEVDLVKKPEIVSEAEDIARRRNEIIEFTNDWRGV